MTAYRAPHRSLQSSFRAKVIRRLVLVAAGSIVSGLWATGIIDLSFLRKQLEPSHEGEVLVPMVSRIVPSYNMVLREDLLNPQLTGWAEQWVPERALPPGAILDRTMIIGRVLNHEKQPNYAFTENDFLPKGTRPGVVAGIPPGKRSMVLETGKIQGLHSLQAGDRFDLLATIPPDKNAPRPVGKGAPAESPRAKVRVLAHNAIVISAIKLRSTPATNPALVGGPRNTSKPVEEVVIAIEPDEIPEITAAMSLEAAITCVARSGHPDDDGKSVVTPPPPPVPPRAIETVHGSKSETVYFEQPQQDDKDARLPSLKGLRLFDELLKPKVPAASTRKDPPESAAPAARGVSATPPRTSNQTVQHVSQ